MRKQWMALVIVLVCLLLPTGLASAQQTTTDFTVTFAPENPYPGQQVIVTVQISDYTQHKDGMGQVMYLLNGLVTNDNGEPIAGSLAFDETGLARFTFYAPSTQDTYNLSMTLTYAQSAVFKQDFVMIVETALPDSLANVFAGLGLFASVMVIMAVGTEVVVELLKTVLGFKTKPTALQALEQLKMEMPGAIAGLGIDPGRQKDLDSLFSSLETTIKPLNNAATQATDMVKAIQSGDFAKVYASLDALQNLAEKTDAEIEQAKMKAVLLVTQAFDLLYARLPLLKSLLEPQKNILLQKIQSLNKDGKFEVLDEFQKLQKIIAEHTADIAGDWLRTQMDVYLSTGRRAVDEKLEKDVLATLSGLGIPEQNLAPFKQGIIEHLDDMERLAHNKVAVYTTAVQNLLDTLEVRRNEIQSPFRKSWRMWRESKADIRWLFFWFPVLGCSLIAVVIGILHITDAQRMWGLPAATFLAMLILAWWAKTKATTLSNLLQTAVDRTDKEKYHCTIGFFLRFFIERGFNKILGRNASITDAMSYGEVDTKIWKEIRRAGPTNMASILLKLEDWHQDQEASRIRLIRVISIVIGIYLAYLLQIDAALYLNYAVPGIGNTINNSVRFPYENLTVGIILTGFAASAGSKFWRDILTRLQESRSQAEEVARVVKKVKDLVPSEQL